MPTTTAPLADHLHIVPGPRAVPEVDPNAVVRSAGGDDLTAGELDSWSNRLARLLLQDGAGPGTAIVIAIDAPIEELVAERAVAKIGAVAVRDSRLPGCGAERGITTRQSRRRTDRIIEWLVLDDRTTLRRYLSGSDAPLGTDHPVLRRTA